MRVSVLIPVYNGSRYIEAAIESVLSQTFQGVEIIVVDDGSEDETASLVKQYKNVRYVYQPHYGISVARNRALQEANFELVDFLDADDLMLPTKLEKQVDYMNEHPECQLVFCQYQNFLDPNTSQITVRQQQIMKVESIHRLIGALMRIDLFKEWGRFNTRLNYGEDTEWLSGIAMNRVDINHFVEEVLYLRRIHASNVSLMHRGLDEKEMLTLRAETFRRFMKRKNKDIERRFWP